MEKNERQPVLFAATDYTIGWMKRFCQVGSNPSAVAGIDMTYKLGPFYVTTVTLPNPMFVYKNNRNKHPTTLAAIINSVSKENRDYVYLARSLKSEGMQSLVYGTDGECALILRAYTPQISLPKATSIIVVLTTQKQTFSRNKTKLNVSEAKRNNNQQEIFGKEFGGKRVLGLVDCEHDAEFEQAYVIKECQWPEEFRHWMFTTKGRHRCMKDTLKHFMYLDISTQTKTNRERSQWCLRGTKKCQSFTL